MKKYQAFTFLLVLIPTITACQDKAHSIIAINSMGSSHALVEISRNELLSLLKSGQQFAFEQYSPKCTHCNDLRPLLEKYTKNKKKTIFTVNMFNITEEDFVENFQTPYPDIFSGYYVPRLQFVNEGKLTYEVSANKFESYTALSKMLDKHFLSSSIVMVETEADLNAFRNANASFLAYCYDLESDKSLSLATKYIINSEVANSKKPVVLINYTTYTGVFNDVCAEFNADFESFAAVVKNNEVTKTIDYSLDDGSELSELIASL